MSTPGTNHQERATQVSTCLHDEASTYVDQRTNHRAKLKELRDDIIQLFHAANEQIHSLRQAINERLNNASQLHTRPNKSAAKKQDVVDQTREFPDRGRPYTRALRQCVHVLINSYRIGSDPFKLTNDATAIPKALFLGLVFGAAALPAYLCCEAAYSGFRHQLGFPQMRLAPQELRADVALGVHQFCGYQTSDPVFSREGQLIAIGGVHKPVGTAFCIGVSREAAIPLFLTAASNVKKSYAKLTIRTIQSAQDKPRRYRLVLVHVDRQRDLALFKLSYDHDAFWPCRPLRLCSTTFLDDKRTLEIAVLKGQVAFAERTIITGANARTFKLNGKPKSDSFGAPIVNANGHVIGLIGGNESSKLAVGIKDIHTFLDDIGYGYLYHTY